MLKWIITGSTLSLLLSGVWLSMAHGNETENEGDAAPKQELRVMCYNVRYSTAPDGENAWPRRQALFLETIRDFNPDLLGTQEVLADQAAFLRHHLPGYGFHGVGRDDGNTRGEYTAILYRRDRFEKLDAGHVWLSEQPDRPGSVSWDSSMTRMFSWVKLRDLQSGRTILFANTHWDHRGSEARRQSAILMRQFVGQYPDATLIVAGDFNTTEDLEPYRIMTRGLEENGRPLIDSYRAVHPQRSEDEATFHAFTGRTRGSRIDWILHSDELQSNEADIIRTNVDGRYPSDHYPISAVMHWRQPSD